jgi:DNA-binding NarL/FixJ family response regulator
VRSASGVDAELPELYISVNAVKFHVQHVVEKLSVTDRTQAAYRVVELGLIY